MRRIEFSTEDKDKIIELYKFGLTGFQIGKRFNCSENVIYRRLKSWGVPIRKKSSMPLRIRFNEDESSKILQWWEEGFSKKEIADLLKTYPKRVEKFLLDRGIHPEPRIATGSKRWNWKGRKNTSSGYVQLLVDKSDPFYCMADSRGYIMEHRYVMAKHLNRPLTSQETVHHIDGFKNNNWLDNLQLRNSKHGNGICFVCLDCGSKNISSEEIL